AICQGLVCRRSPHPAKHSMHASFKTGDRVIIHWSDVLNGSHVGFTASAREFRGKFANKRLVQKWQGETA
ncbi:MAG: hypothetical protein KDG58_17330, partial [Anaerolineae bacterium]|nr:hypothetical protein [Anaerolineae bacterium]